MKITKSQLKQIIKEELKKVMSEDSYDIETGVAAMSPEEIKKQKMEDRIDRIVPEEQELARKVLAGEAGMGQLSPVAQGILLDII
jgi:hypothetical protein|tara:strand:+ start:492 stop:746 length:255 start_codon:yes stop_codon:yes gene_type:complete